jgi:hypothetical protein
LVVEIENMKNCVPQLAFQPLPTPTTTKRAPPPHPAKAPVVEAKPVYFFRRVLIYCDKANLTPPELEFLDALEETIVKINGEVMNVHDIATVPSMKADKEDSPAITGFIFSSGTSQLAILEVLEGGPSEPLLSAFLSAASPSPHLSIVVDFTQHFLSPRAYNQFDCAVKKFKLKRSLDEVLADPYVYVQNSHLSNCFRVLNQLNQLRTISSFEMAGVYQLWPTAQELEMVNAKLGALLTMEELSFPPRQPKPSGDAAAAKEEDTEEEEPLPVLEYLPVVEERSVAPPKGWAHYRLEHAAQVRRARTRCAHVPRECVAADGEVEIWRNPPDPDALAADGWIVERPLPHVPLAESVGIACYGKLFRQTDGTEVRGSRPFYGFASPKSTLPTPEQLKTDQLKESWQDGDKSLANTDLHWMANTRGPVRSSFVPDVHPKDEFEEFHPIAIEEEWRPPLLEGAPRAYATVGVRGRQLFSSVIPPATKWDCFVRTDHDEPPLAVQEEYHDPEVVIKTKRPPTRGHQRFSSVFPNHKSKKGTSDSMTVRALTPTFP